MKAALKAHTIFMFIKTFCSSQICVSDSDENYCFCFDIDDTLIQTNLANFLAYQKAIFEVKGALINPTMLKDRCDKDLLTAFKLSKQKNEYIKVLKDRYFRSFLSFTKINNLMLCFMQILQKQYKVILVTSAKQQRIETLIKYHKLENLPTIFYNLQGNKYKNCLEKFSLNAKFMMIFEDNDKEIKDAQKAGVCDIIKNLRGKNGKLL